MVPGYYVYSFHMTLRGRTGRGMGICHISKTTGPIFTKFTVYYMCLKRRIATCSLLTSDRFKENNSIDDCNHDTCIDAI